MNPIKIVLVGQNQRERSRVARHLNQKYKWHRFRMHTGALRAYNLLNGTGAWKKLPEQRKQEFYDLIYKFNPESFINWLPRRLEKVTDNRPIVIEDARYVSEVQALSAMDFVIIRIVTPHAKIPFGLKAAAPGTVVLNEWYPNAAQKPYNPYYQIVFDDFGDMTKQIEQMIASLENLTFSDADSYTRATTNGWGKSDLGEAYEEAFSTPDKIND